MTRLNPSLAIWLLLTAFWLMPRPLIASDVEVVEVITQEVSQEIPPDELIPPQKPFWDKVRNNPVWAHLAVGSDADIGLTGFHNSWNQRYHTADDSMGIYTAFFSDSFSEVMSIDAVVDQFRGPLEPGSVAVTHNSAEVGVVYEGWRFARVLRYDYVLKFSQDTALLNFQLERGGSENIDLDYVYDLYLEVDHLRSTGILVGKTFPVKIFKPGLLDIELSWLESEQFYDGYLVAKFQRGQLTEDSLETFQQQLDVEDTAEIDTFAEIVAEAEQLQLVAADIRDIIETSDLWLSTDYAFYEPGLREDEIDSLNEIRNLNPKGRGAALSLQWFMPINDRWTVQFAARDLFSAIRWKEVGRTNGSVRITDAALSTMDVVDQYIQEDLINRFSGAPFRPLNPADPDNPEGVFDEISEQIEAENAPITSTKGSYTQRLPTQYQLLTHFHINPIFTAEMLYRRNKLADFLGFGIWAWQYFYVGLEPETRSYQLGARHRWGSLMLRTDSSAVEDAKRLTLEGSINLVF